MVRGTPNKEWSEKISDVGLKRKAKIQKGAPFRGVWNGGTNYKDNPRERTYRTDMFGAEEWEWERLKQNFASHLLVDTNLENVKKGVNYSDITSDDIIDCIEKGNNLK